jgi:hypothetical protein
MLRQIVLGAVVSICSITIHALVMTLLVGVARRVSTIRTASPSLFLTTIMIVTVSVLMAAHASEVAVWSAAYLMVGAVPPGNSALYFAFVNYTTLGYGDILPAKEWQLIGPITAMNGVLLFGWSTAVIFDVLRKAMMLDSRTIEYS